MNIAEFEDLIWGFIEENVTSGGCRECHTQGLSLIPDDYKGSYKKALEKLYEDLKNEKC